MHRLTAAERNKLVSSVKQGFSINEISNALLIPKTTVYHYFRKIKGKTISAPRIVFSSPEQEGELLGIFAGDGSLCFSKRNYAYYVNVHVGNDATYAKYVEGLFERCFGKNFCVCHDSNQKIVRVSSKTIYNYFTSRLVLDPHEKCSTVHLRELPNDTSFVRGFLRGLLETDGTIYYRGKTLAVQYYTVSAKLANQTRLLLDRMGLNNGEYVSMRDGANYPIHSIYLLSGSTIRLVELLAPFHSVAKINAVQKLETTK